MQSVSPALDHTSLPALPMAKPARDRLERADSRHGSATEEKGHPELHIDANAAHHSGRDDLFSDSCHALWFQSRIGCMLC